MRVAIIGAGFGGIAAAIALQREHDVFLIDRAHDVGGTWLLNDYPGAACDVPSHLYSFSFEQRRHWPRLCSPRDEILAYIRELAAKYGIKPTLNTEIATADYDDGWTLTRHRRSHVHRRRADRRHRPAPPHAHAEAAGHLRGPHVPLRRVGPRLRPDRQARRGHRHGRERGPVHPRDRRQGQAARRLPAHGQLVPAAQEPPVPARRQSRHPARPQTPGRPPHVRLPLRRDAHRRHPPPADARPDRPRPLRRVHALAAARPPGAAQSDLARLRVRLQARAVQLALPARAGPPQRHARHRPGHAHEPRRQRPRGRLPHLRDRLQDHGLHAPDADHRPRAVRCGPTARPRTWGSPSRASRACT